VCQHSWRVATSLLQTFLVRKFRVRPSTTTTTRTIRMNVRRPPPSPSAPSREVMGCDVSTHAQNEFSSVPRIWDSREERPLISQGFRPGLARSPAIVSRTVRYWTVDDRPPYGHQPGPPLFRGDAATPPVVCGCPHARGRAQRSGSPLMNAPAAST
jgi:hypothetical protein